MRIRIFEDPVTDLSDRFWSKVDKTSSVYGCWLWSGRKDKRRLWEKTVQGVESRKRHRIAWIISYGEIPAGMVICHRCDNRACVKLDHLFIGTPQDNVKDMLAKGRYNYEKNKMARSKTAEAKRTRPLCGRGHSYSEHGKIKSTGQRYCSLCERLSRQKLKAGRGK